MSPQPKSAETPIRTKYGPFILKVFSWSPNEQDNILVLETKTLPRTPLVRIQSACYTGEIFGSTDCDCHWQLETSLIAIHKEGGAFIYMLKDGRGAGLLAKIRGMALSAEEGIDTAESYKRLDIPADPREYGLAAYALRRIGINSLRLLTNNPRKIEGLRREGFEVIRVPLESEPTELNRDYLEAKAMKLGHLMKAFGTDPEF